MAKTVEEGFGIFHTWLTPTGTESAKAKSHRSSIDDCLKANLGIKRFFRTGSFGNATSISSYSDVDYFINIPREKLKQDSNITLSNLKQILDSRFPDSGVHIDVPAVVIPFGDDPAETTEIVPADFIKRENDCSIYEIPDGNGGWMLSSPEYHKSYIDQIDYKLGEKVKPLIRFIKAWKYYKDVPISSFYLEMFVGLYAQDEKSIVYSIDINNIFSRLLTQKLPAIEDPMGISGFITACKNESEKAKILSELEDASRRVSKARVAEKENRNSDAFYWWNAVYDGMFPSY